MYVDDLKCNNCSDGVMKLRESDYGEFAGCSNFPKCKNKMSFNELFVKTPIPILVKKQACWKCNKITYVIYYRMIYHGNSFGALGDIEEIDEYLSVKYVLKKNFSKTLNAYSFSNNCQHCGSLQGNHFVLDHIDTYSPKNYQDMDIGSTTVLEYINIPKFKEKIECIGYLSGYHLE